MRPRDNQLFQEVRETSYQENSVEERISDTDNSPQSSHIKDECTNRSNQLLKEVSASHQESSVEDGASGTDSSDSEFHCPVVAPDTVLDWDRIDSVLVSKRGVLIRMLDKNNIIM